MATLYFRSTSPGAGDNDWSNTLNWWTSIAFTTHAGRLPNSGDTVYICDDVTSVSGGTNVVVNTAYFGITTPAYPGYWTGDSIGAIAFTCVNCYVPNGHIWCNTASFTVSSLTVVQGTGFIEGGLFYQTGGSVNFYDNSTNAGPDDIGIIYLQNNAVCNFYNYSANGNVGGLNDGTVTGKTNFYNYSTNGNADGGDAVTGYVVGNANFYNYSTNTKSASNDNGQTSGIGIVTGNATFYDHATNYSYSIFGGYVAQIYGVVNGILTYAYSRTPAQISLEIGVAAQSIAASAVVPVSGGISRSNVLLTQLLKLPFPIVV